MNAVTSPIVQRALKDPNVREAVREIIKGNVHDSIEVVAQNGQKYKISRVKGN